MSRVLLRLLAASAVVALTPVVPAQTLQVSPLHWMRGNEATGVAREMQQTPAVCFGAGTFLAAWTDARARVPAEFGAQNEDDVYAARLDANGDLIDVVPFPVATGPGYQRNPQIAWNGSSWLVAWVSQTPVAGYYQSRVLAARVAPDGTVLDAPFQVVPVGSGYTLSFTLASNGSDWCVVTQSDTGSGLVGARVSPAGVVLDPAGVVLVPGQSFLYFGSRLASAGGEYLLAYQGNTLEARRFDASLQPIGGAFAVPSEVIGSNGAQYYVCWYGGTALVGSPMSTSGVLQIPAGATLSPNAPGTNELAFPSWDGSRWWVAWNWQQAPYAARVAANGAVLDVGGVLVDPTHSTYTYNVTVSAGAGGAQVMWHDGRTELWDAYGVHVDGNAQAAPAQALARSAVAERRPRLANGPAGQSLAVAVGELSGLRLVLAWRLDPAGQGLDSQPIQVGAGLNATTPSVAFDGTRYLVAWYQDGNIVARRMLPDASFLDAAPFPVMPGWSPDVAALGGAFLVVGAHAPSYPQYVSAFARRVDGSTGALLDAAPVPLTSSYVRSLDVTAFGTKWLAVVQRNFTHDDSQSAVEAVLIDQSGVPSAAISVAFSGGGAPSADASPGRALIAYRTGSMSSANNDVAGRLMNLDGSLAGNAFAISTASGAGWAKQFEPAVAWDGTNFVVAWSDQRNQTSFFDARSDIYAARVSPLGIVLDPSGIAIENSPDPECYPTLLGRDDAVLFAASIFRRSPPYSAYRLGTRLLFEGAPVPYGFCAALPNSSGSPAAISATGNGSLSANALTLACANMPSNGSTLVFHATEARDPALPFGNGLLCTAGAFRRLPAFTYAGNSATQVQDFGWPGYFGVSPGDTRYFQFWFRDVPAGGSGYNLSNGLVVTFAP